MGGIGEGGLLFQAGEKKKPHVPVFIVPSVSAVQSFLVSDVLSAT